MPKSTVVVTIPAGSAVSTSADLTGSVLTTLIAPASWTSANLSFAVSADNITFSDLFDEFGQEVLKPIGPGRAVLVDPALTQSALYIKLRSGPRANPVLQSADRAFTLLLA